MPATVRRRTPPATRPPRARALGTAALAALGVALGAALAGAAGAQALPGMPGPGGAPLPPAPTLPRDEIAPPASLPAPRPVPHLGTVPDAQPADPAALGIVTHRPGGATTTRAAPAAVQSALAAPDNGDLPAPRMIGPHDSRTRVADTTAYPARATGLLLSDFGGLESYCSAALVGPASILTAAHCVYDPASGWAQGARFLPGLDGRDTAPYGAWPVVAMHLPTGFLAAQPGDYGAVVGYDLALLHLSAPLGNALGWFGYGAPLWRAAPDAQPPRLRLLSYPGDKPAGTQWQAVCAPAPVPGAPGLAAHRCPTFAGSSGGPMYPTGPAGSAPRIAAVNVAETSTHNLGVVIGPAWSAWLSEVWR